MATREPRERRLSNRELLFASEAGSDGGGNNIDPFALAMQLLGMQQKRREVGEAREFEREKLGEQQGFEREKFGAEERRAAEALGLQTRQQTEAELTGAETRRLAGLQERRAADAATAAAEQQKFANQLAERKLIADALDKVAGVQQLTPEVQAMIEQLPGMSSALMGVRGRQDLANTLPELQLAYTEPDAARRDAAIAAVYGKMTPYSRENAPWQDLNALIKPDVPRPAGQTPTAVNVAQGAVNPALAQGEAGRRAAMGRLVPPQPAPPEFAYEEGYPSAQPNYMYGIPTPDASDIINKYEADPRFKTAEQETFEWIKNLFGGGNTEQIEAVPPEEAINAPPEFTYEEGYPSAMPPEMSLLERAGLNARMNLGRRRGKPNIDAIMSILNQPRARIGD